MATASTTELAAERAVAAGVALFSDETTSSSILVNRISGKIHLPYLGEGGIEEPGRAKCGWRFTHDEHDVLPQLPRTNAPLICGVCLPKHKRACRLADNALAASSSLVATSSSSS